MKNFELKTWYMAVFLVLVLLLTFIGLWSEVTWTVVLTRALLSSALISGLMIAMDILLRAELKVQGLAGSEEKQGQVDIRVESDDSLYQELLKPEFRPMVPNQLDQEVNQLVNRDPKQAADLLRQLGIDE